MDETQTNRQNDFEAASLALASVAYVQRKIDSGDMWRCRLCGFLFDKHDDDPNIVGDDSLDHVCHDCSSDWVTCAKCEFNAHPPGQKFCNGDVCFEDDESNYL